MQKLSADDLPEIERAELDDATLEAFFERIAEEAERLSVMAKGAPLQRTDGAVLTLERAKQAFLAGEVGALQLRYVHHDVIILDTLMRRGPNLTLLARMLQR
ncbi:MAG: hypothetical protein GXP55_24810 [Deltaproteobacteria bacterium]|nr:hypothetical protein [Deltaproteobacteria bacterium]